MATYACRSRDELRKEYNNMVTRYEDLPENARKYVERVLELVGGRAGDRHGDARGRAVVGPSKRADAVSRAQRRPRADSSFCRE